MPSFFRMFQIGILILCLATTTLFAEKPRATSKKSLGMQSPVRTDLLDTVAIHALYMDGEFEPALEKLEDARRMGLLKTHGDSVFAFKHLGVMYAAKYETQETGKRYMYQLLSIEPSVRILDMYASDMIYMIFKNVQAEYEIRMARPGTDSLKPVSASTGPSTAHPRTSLRRTWPYWMAGAILIVGTGTAAYFLLDNETPEPTRYNGKL
jgi:hypothetical protein